MRKKIETEKYEGHVLVDGKWVKHAMSQEEYDATKALIKDAPLILDAYKEKCEEVKRLREGIKQMADTWLNSPNMDGREKVVKMTNQMRELVE